MDAVKAFAEDDAAAQKLATPLTNVTGATDAQVSAVEDYITKTSIAAAVADDELRPALDSLVRGTGSVTEAQDLLGLALDISAGTGKDLGTVSDALSKAYNGNYKALKALDPQLADLTLEQQFHPPQQLRHREGRIRRRLGTRKQIHARICQPHEK